MKTLRTFFDWAVCGYDEAGYGGTYWLGFRFGHNRRGRLALALLEFFLRDFWQTPERLRHWLADRLMRWAMRLRGQTPTTFGFYDYGRGNRASVLMDRIDGRLCDELLPEKPDELDNARVDLAELASLCGACWYRNDGSEDGIPAQPPASCPLETRNNAKAEGAG